MSAGAGIVRPFLLTAPVALLAAGVVLAVEGSLALRSRWDAATLALTHLGTLGFLSFAMLGLVYRVAPSIARSSAPGPRRAHAVYALALLGVASLMWSLRGDARWAVFVSMSALASALLLFIAPVSWSLRKAWPATDAAALLLALASLFVTGFLGLWMLHGHGGMLFPGPRGLWVQVHLGIGLMGWVGCLQSALLWHLVPTTGPRTPGQKRVARLALGLIAAGILLPVLVLIAEWVGLFRSGRVSPNAVAALAASPAGLAVWVVQPLQNLRALSRPDARHGTLLLPTGLGLAPVVGLAALVAYFAADERSSLLLGWLAIWGWAGMLAHGLILRELTSGDRPTGSTRLSFALHLASLIAGALAILSGIPWTARAAGLLLVATALSLGREARRRGGREPG